MRITKYNLENTQQYTITVRQLPELDHVKIFATDLISLGLYGWDKSYGNKINTSSIFRTYGSKNDALSRIFSITPYEENLTISKDISKLKVSIENINANIDDVNENIEDINGNIEDINANLGDIHTILDTLNGEVI